MSAALLSKRQKGQFYTEGNPFVLEPFLEWAEQIHLKEKIVLEPFAGANNIIRALQQVGFANDFKSFDIEPADPHVEYQDTLAEFPSGFEVCITNPPWLAKNSAKRRGLAFPDTHHDDLYKFSLEKCLAYSPYVAALIPATYLQSGAFLSRLSKVIFLHDQSMFLDTENPVCLALFVPQSEEVLLFNDNNLIGSLEEMKKLIPRPAQKRSLDFNHPEGELGFIAFDSTKGPTIRFVEAKELGDYSVGHSSRMITRIKIDTTPTPSLIERLNNQVNSFRDQSKDVFLTPFKGLRKDGMYRRRMDYSLARKFIDTYA